MCCNGSYMACSGELTVFADRLLIQMRIGNYISFAPYPHLLEQLMIEHG